MKDKILKIVKEERDEAQSEIDGPTFYTLKEFAIFTAKVRVCDKIIGRINKLEAK